MIVVIVMSLVLLALGVTSWICDRMDAHDELKHNEYVARCRAYHPAGRR